MKIQRLFTRVQFDERLFSGFDDFYRAQRDKIQINNINDAINGKCDKDIEKRARNLYKDWAYAKNNYTEDAFVQTSLDAVHNKETFALGIYVKSDKKQNSAEECQTNYIEDKFKGLVDVFGLPKSGTSSLFISSSGSIGKTKGTTKSLDIKLSYSYSGKTLEIYGTLKHIDNYGGAQDNQFNDLIATNKDFIKNTDPNIYTLTIYSGTYFKPKKVSALKVYENSQNKVSQIDDLENVLKDIIISWLQINFPDTSLDEQNRVKAYVKKS